MGHKKLLRFTAIDGFKNVLQHPANMQGNWHSYFNNHNPITLELACGKGEYSVGLGRMNATQNFIGIDIKGNRIWRGAKTALEEGLNNVAFLRIEIDKLADYFAKDEVSEIWITFPDPQLRISKAKKRLTHNKFLRIYKQVLKVGGVIHLKTDSPNLYEFTKKVIEINKLNCLVDYDDLYANNGINETLKIKTHYESLDIAQSNKIHYLQFTIDNELNVQNDVILKNAISDNTAII